MFFRMHFGNGKFYEVREWNAFRWSIIVEAPDEASFSELTKKKEGPYARRVPFGDIEMGVEKEFLMANNIRFKAMPIEEYKSKFTNRGDFFVKLKVTESVFVYVLVEDGVCCYLEPL